MMSSTLLPHERQALIREQLARDGRVIAHSLAKSFETSEDTIRRDLREMASAGLCRRVYGGALAPSVEFTPISARIGEHRDIKEALGRATASLFEPGMTVLIDAGSTNLAVARAIPPGLALTVVTNAPTIAAALIDRPDISLVMIGGAVDMRAGAALGARAIQDLGQTRPDLFLLGGCGLDVAGGVSASGFEEAEFKRAAVDRARAVVVAIAPAKLGISAPFSVLPLSGLSHIVLAGSTDLTLRRAIEAEGVAVKIAEAPV